MTEIRTVDRVPIPQQILWRRVPWKRLYDLLGSPHARGVQSCFEIDDLPATVAEDYQHEQDPESGGGNREESASATSSSWMQTLQACVKMSTISVSTEFLRATPISLTKIMERLPI